MCVEVEIPPRYLRTIRRLAAERNDSFERNPTWDNTDRTWGVDPGDRNAVGLAGEMAFAIYADLAIDSSTKRWGDGGTDFDVFLDGERTRIDVKTAQKQPKCLMVKEYAVKADYYILGHYNGEGTVTFYGGATSGRVRNGIRKESYRFGHTNLTLGLASLDPMPDPESLTRFKPPCRNRFQYLY